jgi:hypothetical protein
MNVSLGQICATRRTDHEARNEVTRRDANGLLVALHFGSVNEKEILPTILVKPAVRSVSLFLK